MKNLFEEIYYKCGFKDCNLRSDLVSVQKAKELFKNELQRISDAELLLAPEHHLYHGIEMCDKKIMQIEQKRNRISRIMDFFENPFGIRKVSR